MTRLVHAGTFRAGETAVVVLTNRTELAEDLSLAFRDLVIGDDAPESSVVFEVLHSGETPPANPWSVTRDGDACEQTVADQYIRSYLLWEITRLVFERPGERVHLHGAALSLEGRAIVLAGESHVGKSTLAGWLTYRGWEFLTDEAALIDADRMVVHPFWRPIGVRRPGPLDVVLDAAGVRAGSAPELLLPASRVGRLGGTTALSSIFFPTIAHRARTAVVPMTAAEALLELTRHFPGLALTGRTGFGHLVKLVRSVSTYRLTVGDLDEADKLLRATLLGALGPAR